MRYSLAYIVLTSSQDGQVTDCTHDSLECLEAKKKKEVYERTIIRLNKIAGTENRFDLAFAPSGKFVEQVARFPEVVTNLVERLRAREAQVNRLALDSVVALINSDDLDASNKFVDEVDRIAEQTENEVKELKEQEEEAHKFAIKFKAWMNDAENDLDRIVRNVDALTASS